MNIRKFGYKTYMWKESKKERKEGVQTRQKHKADHVTKGPHTLFGSWSSSPSSSFHFPLFHSVLFQSNTILSLNLSHRWRSSVLISIARMRWRLCWKFPCRKKVSRPRLTPPPLPEPGTTWNHGWWNPPPIQGLRRRRPCPPSSEAAPPRSSSCSASPELPWFPSNSPPTTTTIPSSLAPSKTNTLYVIHPKFSFSIKFILRTTLFP